MEKIKLISYEIINNTDNLIELEDCIKTYMHEILASLLGGHFYPVESSH